MDIPINASRKLAIHLHRFAENELKLNFALWVLRKSTGEWIPLEGFFVPFAESARVLSNRLHSLVRRYAKDEIEREKRISKSLRPVGRRKRMDSGLMSAT